MWACQPGGAHTGLGPHPRRGQEAIQLSRQPQGWGPAQRGSSCLGGSQWRGGVRKILQLPGKAQSVRVLLWAPATQLPERRLVEPTDRPPGLACHAEEGLELPAPPHGPGPGLGLTGRLFTLSPPQPPACWAPGSLCSLLSLVVSYYQRKQVAEQCRATLGLGLLGGGGHSSWTPGPIDPFQDVCGQPAKSLVSLATISAQDGTGGVAKEGPLEPSQPQEQSFAALGRR